MTCITFIAAEFPYPPNHGGRADTWQRLCAFASRGVRLQLICWYSDRRGGPPDDSQLQVVRKIVQDLVVLPIDVAPADLAWRLVNLGRMPSHASARMPRGNSSRQVVARIQKFNPAAIWLDGLWPGAFARFVSKQLHLPYFYRSHNVEHVYMAKQAALATSLVYRLRLLLTLFGLKQFEQRVVLGAADVFDISVDDLAFWRKQGLPGGHWLPPIVINNASTEAASTKEETHFDIVFVGNLHTPNNVEGLRWLLLEVWPMVIGQRPDATALIAGSVPNAEVQALVRQARGVELRSNPVDVWPLYRAARVLVNPVRSGSGVNIKSVEMLQLDCPIVSTGVGAGGLPPEIQRHFTVTDDAADFAGAILRALAGDATRASPADRREARAAFAPVAINKVIEVIQRRLSDHPTSRQAA